MLKILDAHGLMLFLEKEPGYERVKAYFVAAVEKRQSLLMTAVNFGEVYYTVLRDQGKEIAEEVEKIIDTLPLEIVDVNKEIAKEAGRIKTISKMSYADCFAAALAKIRKGEIITGDPEFKSIEKEIKIDWVN